MFLFVIIEINCWRCWKSIRIRYFSLPWFWYHKFFLETVNPRSICWAQIRLRESQKVFSFEKPSWIMNFHKIEEKTSFSLLYKCLFLYQNYFLPVFYAIHRFYFTSLFWCDIKDWVFLYHQQVFLLTENKYLLLIVKRGLLSTIWVPDRATRVETSFGTVMAIPSMVFPLASDEKIVLQLLEKKNSNNLFLIVSRILILKKRLEFT